MSFISVFVSVVSRAGAPTRVGLCSGAVMALSAVLFGSGCGTPQAFMPAARVAELSPGNPQLAADYVMEDKGQRLGDAKVWSKGVFRDSGEGKTTTIAHVGFVIQNTTNAPLRFDEKRLMLEDVQLNDETIYEIPPATIDGELVIPPAQTRSVDVAFDLPYRVWPGDVLVYRVRWTIDHGAPYTGRTAFVRNGFRSGRYPAHAYLGYPYDGGFYPYGYPYGYGPYGYGLYIGIGAYPGFWGSDPFYYPRVYRGGGWGGYRGGIAPSARPYFRTRLR